MGLAGTVSTLAALELGLTHYERDRIHHSILSRDAVQKWCDVLGSERVGERAQRVAIPEGRQDVIFGGALVLRECMGRFGFAECIVSEADILDGLVLSQRRPGSPGTPLPWPGGRVAVGLTTPARSWRSPYQT